MRIFVVSDTHGNTEEFLHKAVTLAEPDLIIHLGDYVEDGIAIEKAMEVETIKIRGNCDYSISGYDEDRVFKIGNKNIFITHGHKYNVRFGIDNLFYRAEEIEADLALFGHTHVPLLIRENNIMIMNPGSPSLPRSVHRKKTFGIIEIDENIEGKIIEV